MYLIQKVLGRKDYATVVFSSGEFIRIPKPLFEEYKPVPGMSVEEHLYSLFKDAELRSKMYFYLTQLILRRFYSVFEVRRKLNNKYNAREAADFVIAKALQEGLLDDERFAEIYLRSLAAKNKYSNRELKNKLRAKGISSSLQDKLLSPVAALTSESVALKKMMIKTLRYYSSKSAGTTELNKKVIASLMRKGYQWKQVQEMLSGLTNEIEAG